jgi:hypothetical protein
MEDLGALKARASIEFLISVILSFVIDSMRLWRPK